MNNIFEKIYCINLDRETEKIKYFDNEIKKTTIGDYTKFSAIDGYNINLDLIDNKTITDQARNHIKRKKQKTFGISLTFGSLGCALSHKKIFEECKNSDKPFLIFEDDIIIEPNFNNIFQLVIENLTMPYDIIYLGYNEIPGFKKTKIDDVLSKPNGLITGLYGYILSPSGAQILLSTIFPLNKQIDSSISDNVQKLKLFCSTQRIVGVTHKFGSKTQKEESCKNIYHTDDDWKKLFQKV